MITYLVRDRGSFKHFCMLKCYLELTYTKGSQDSLPLTDKNFLKFLNEPLLVFPDWPCCKCGSFVRPFQKKCQNWSKDTQELLGRTPFFFSGINIECVINFLAFSMSEKMGTTLPLSLASFT